MFGFKARPMKWITKIDHDILESYAPDLTPALRSTMIEIAKKDLDRTEEEIYIRSAENSHYYPLILKLPDEIHNLIKGKYELKYQPPLIDDGGCDPHVVLAMDEDEMVILKLQSSIFNNVIEYPEDMNYYTLKVSRYDFERISRDDDFDYDKLDEKYQNYWFSRDDTETIEYAKLKDSDIEFLKDYEHAFTNEPRHLKLDNAIIHFFTTEKKIKKALKHFGENARLPNYQRNFRILELENYPIVTQEYGGTPEEVAKYQSEYFSYGRICWMEVISRKKISETYSWIEARFRSLSREDIKFLDEYVVDIVGKPNILRLDVDDKEFKKIQKHFKKYLA